ncbi:hypothetical protein EMA8858_04146 [Emticicia aquatica]|uniref:Uncharacterized protein n=1 Tax=Emticicia aquatica TaxID=1681835 RepID=A0ABM9AVE2_9BACT|nr:hypothetical protein [Emticicia aquatica]CAH0998011.1 hypothetical protein EMA8858_04146 [Emticicia aquatica]
MNLNKFDKIFEDLFHQDYIVSTMDNEYGFDLIHELKTKDFIYQSQSAVYKLTEKGYEVKEKGSYKAYVESVNKNNDKELFIRQLEIDKSKLEIEKLDYEKSIRELDSSIKVLTSKNLKLQNFDIKFRWLIAFLSFILGLIIEHKALLIDLIVRVIIR